MRWSNPARPSRQCYRGFPAPGDANDIVKLAALGGKTGKDTFRSPVKDFYFTNPIARASAVMAECSALARSGFKQAAE